MLPSRARQAMMVNLHQQPPPPLPRLRPPSPPAPPRQAQSIREELETFQLWTSHLPGTRRASLCSRTFHLSKGVWLTPPHGGIKKLCQGRASFATSEHHVCWHCKIAEEFNKRSFQNVHSECTKDCPKWVSSWPGELSGWEITSKYSDFAFPVCLALLLCPLPGMTHMDKGSRHLPLLRQAARSSELTLGGTSRVDVWRPHPCPRLQLWHSVIYKEVLAPSILAGTPTLCQTPATSCLGALMLEVQAQWQWKLPAACCIACCVLHHQPGSLWGFRTGQGQMLREICAWRQNGAGPCSLVSVYWVGLGTVHTQVSGGPIQRKCLKTHPAWAPSGPCLTPRIPVAKLAPINLSRKECCIKGDTPQISTSLTDNRQFGATGQSCYSWQ